MVVVIGESTTAEVNWSYGALLLDLDGGLGVRPPPPALLLGHVEGSLVYQAHVEALKAFVAFKQHLGVFFALIQ